MLKNLSLISLSGIAAVGVPSELCAKNVKVVGTQKVRLPSLSLVRLIM